MECFLPLTNVENIQHSYKKHLLFYHPQPIVCTKTKKKQILIIKTKKKKGS